VGHATTFHVNGIVLLVSTLWVLVLLRRPAPKAMDHTDRQTGA
jgi:hypothetical protein